MPLTLKKSSILDCLRFLLVCLLVMVFICLHLACLSPTQGTYQRQRGSPFAPSYLYRMNWSTSQKYVNNYLKNLSHKPGLLSNETAPEGRALRRVVSCAVRGGALPASIPPRAQQRQSCRRTGRTLRRTDGTATRPLR